MDKQEIMRRMQQALAEDDVPAVSLAHRARLISDLSRMRVRLGKSIKKRLKKIEGLISRPFRYLRDRLFRRARQRSKLLEQLHQMLLEQSQQHGRQEEIQSLLVARQDGLHSLQKQTVLEVRSQVGDLRRACVAVLDGMASSDASQVEAGCLSVIQADRVCRICEGQLAFKWTLPVLHGRYQADYSECVACQSLQVSNPHWLQEAYHREAHPLLDNPDQGRFQRNFTVYSYLRAFVQSGIIERDSTLLDYGGGYGLLTSMLRNAGMEAWQYDQYIDQPFLAEKFHIGDLRDIPDGTFDVVTAFEVMEHLVTPHEAARDWRRILKPNGVLVLTTGLYRSGEHDAHWPYLSTEFGQHVTLWSSDGISHLAKQYGFRSVGYLGWAIILSPQPVSELQASLERAAQSMSQPDFWATITKCWELDRTAAPVATHHPKSHPTDACRREAA